MPTKLLQATLGLRPRSEQDMETLEFRLLVVFAIAAMLFGFLLNTPAEIWEGTGRILVSPSVLLSDYMEIGNPGATWVNAGFMMLIYVLYVRLHHDHFTGPLVAALFTIFGFAFFGKNLINSLPITLGVYLWARLENKPSANYLAPSLFGTALAPAISFIIFGKGLPIWLGVIIGYAVGIAIGLLIPPLAAAFMKFHHGLSLYNVGFVAGIIGMVVVAIFNMYGRHVPDTFYEFDGSNWPEVAFVMTFSVLIFIAGFYYNGSSLQGMRGFMRQSGRAPSDFFALEGLGRTLMNLGLMGAMTTALVLITGGHMNGPVLGGIFTVIGFSAFGKNPRNAIFVIAGVLLAAAIMGRDLGSTPILVIALFGTTLSPITGVYGPIYGVIAGFLHMAIVGNVAFLHGGLNLYNNGFSAGFVALILIPVFNAILRIRKKTPPEFAS